MVRPDGDDRLLDEQIDFYRTDAASFDDWLAGLVDPRNHAPIARFHRAGRQRIRQLFAQRAPLGDVLEIAAGTGRLAELYLPHADSAMLLDASPESLAIAARRLDGDPRVTVLEADVFDWEHGSTFDTIVFSSWLHHVPRSRFSAFWATVQSLLARDGRAIFDFPDAELSPTDEAAIPTEPTEAYGVYPRHDGTSVRDHFGRRWRVIHTPWPRAELASRLADLGWAMELVGPGLFETMVWAEATR